MVRAAVIGLGKMGISHLAIVRAHPSVEMVAVCDTMRYGLDVLNKYTGVKTYTDYKALLDGEQLDAVVIATPSRFHGEIVRAALERNIHVFCEKPFCLDFREGQELAALAESKGLVNQVGYHYRFVGTFQEVRRLITLGAVGNIHHVRAEAYGPVVLRPKGSTWRTSRHEGGGCLYDYASHAIDLLNYLVGPPASVRGSMLNQIFSRDVDDEVYSTLVYPNGMTGQLAANWSDESFRKMSMKISVWGEAGRITADRQEVQIYAREDQPGESRLQKGWNVRYTTELSNEVWYYLRGEEYSAQIDHFIKSIETETKTNVSPFSAGLETDAVIFKILRDSAGEPVDDIFLSSSAPKQKSVFGRVFGR